MDRGVPEIVAFQEGEHRILRDGCLVVEDGVVRGADVEAATRRVQRAGERTWSRWPDRDRAGRTLDEVAPQSYAAFDG